MLQLKNLAKRFGVHSIFEDLSLNFPAGERIAIYGRNGSGKSTLLNMICGLDQADSGTIVVPKGQRLGFLQQQASLEPKPTLLSECLTGAEALMAVQDEREALLAKMHGVTPSAEQIARLGVLDEQFDRLGGYSIEARAKKILAGLGLSEFSQHPSNLSGGMRMRLELAKLFLQEPDILVLDEPTNHLDLPSLAWMERYLGQFPGTLLLVSHDRDLVNGLATHIAHLKSGRLSLYKGNLDAFLTQVALERQLQQQTLDRLGQKRKKMEAFVARFGAKATKAKQANSRKKQIERLIALEDGISVDSLESVAQFQLPEPPKAGRIVLELDALSVGYDQPLMAPLSLTIESGQRVAVIGANGIGKSSLLKSIIGQVTPLGGSATFGHKVAPFYLAQDQNEQLDLDSTLLGNITAINPDLTKTEARKILGAFLFSGETVEKTAAVLSGGEKNRLGFARMLCRPANLILLDEPTNHLDLDSIELLTATLADYKGTMLFVSHDRDFINNVCTHVLVLLADGRHQLFVGDLGDYRRRCAELGFPDVFEPLGDEPKTPKSSSQRSADQSRAGQRSADQSSADQSSTNQSVASPRPAKSNHDFKKAKAAHRKLSQRLEGIEQKQATADKALAAIDAELHSADPEDFTALAELGEKRNAQLEKIEALDGDWLTTADELETAKAHLDSFDR